MQVSHLMKTLMMLLKIDMMEDDKATSPEIVDAVDGVTVLLILNRNWECLKINQECR